MCCTITEQTVADIVFDHEDLFHTLADVDEIISQCKKFVGGKAFFTTGWKTPKEDAWYIIDLEEFNLACEECKIVNTENIKVRLIYDLIEEWSDKELDWDTTVEPFEEMAEDQRKVRGY